MIENQPVTNPENPEREPFLTIDDLIAQTEGLLNGLKKLGEYKHPMDIRKGVIGLKSERESVTIKATGRVYFLDIKETREGSPYLVITESRSKKGEGNERERNSIVIFQENARDFADAVTEMLAQISG